MYRSALFLLKNNQLECMNFIFKTSKERNSCVALDSGGSLCGKLRSTLGVGEMATVSYQVILLLYFKYCKNAFRVRLFSILQRIITRKPIHLPFFQERKRFQKGVCGLSGFIVQFYFKNYVKHFLRYDRLNIIYANNMVVPRLKRPLAKYNFVFNIINRVFHRNSLKHKDIVIFYRNQVKLQYLDISISFHFGIAH